MKSQNKIQKLKLVNYVQIIPMLRINSGGYYALCVIESQAGMRKIKLLFRGIQINPEVIKIKKTSNKEKDMLICRYCNKECKNANSLRNHERFCKQNPERTLTSYEQGYDTFARSRKFGAVSIHEGQETCNRQCPHCHKWFKPSQFGSHIARCSKVHNEERRYIKNGIVFDVSEKYVFDYLNSHLVCEICGKSIEESKNPNSKNIAKRLCIDHDHKTNCFRGVLCQSCNRQLGWYEKHSEAIDSYLERK